jgi:hypothetical protein
MKKLQADFKDLKDFKDIKKVCILHPLGNCIDVFNHDKECCEEKCPIINERKASKAYWESIHVSCNQEGYWGSTYTPCPNCKQDILVKFDFNKKEKGIMFYMIEPCKLCGVVDKTYWSYFDYKDPNFQLKFSESYGETYENMLVKWKEMIFEKSFGMEEGETIPLIHDFTIYQKECIYHPKGVCMYGYNQGGECCESLCPLRKTDDLKLGGF